MAVDKLVDSTQLDADLTSVANAIRTKGGTSGHLTFPSGFISAVQAISGGGALPSVISKIDGGSFTPAIDLQSSQLAISHTLGAVPKGFVIWTEDELGGTIATRYAAQLALSASNVHASNSNIYVGVGLTSILYNGTASSLDVRATSTQINSFMTSTEIKWNNTLVYCKAGCQYKWLAWA